VPDPGWVRRVKGGRSPAKRTLDAVRSAQTLASVGRGRLLVACPRARPAARTSGYSFRRRGSPRIPTPTRAPAQLSLDFRARSRQGSRVDMNRRYTGQLALSARPSPPRSFKFDEVRHLSDIARDRLGQSSVFGLVRPRKCLSQHCVRSIHLALSPDFDRCAWIHRGAPSCLPTNKAHGSTPR
jgi:hypothetical protein